LAIFVDTSGLYALLSANDPEHQRATDFWQGLLGAEEEVATHNYVNVEATALVQRRLGLAAVADLAEVLAPATIQWVDSELHQAALATLLAMGRRNLSFVDVVSFEFMRRRGIRQAFAFDTDFRVAGFELVPA
jgi:uncharacterized protein